MDEYIDHLREAGSKSGGGRFEVDAERAREKLQKFQLADPHRYVLQFVEAAHLLGATWIAIEIDADEVEFHFNGDPLLHGHLTEFESAAFQQVRDDRSAAVRRLAIGAVAAREIDPERIEITSSGSWADGVRLVVDDEGSRVEYHDGPAQGTTHLYLKETFRASHLTEFVHKFGHELVEESLIRDQCQFASCEITLNGDPVGRGPVLPEGTVGQIEFASEDRRGTVGFLDPARLETLEGTKVGDMRVLQNGVLVEEHSMRSRRGLTAVEPYAVVKSGRLNRDLSQSGIVRDEAWREVVRGVADEELNRSLATFVEGLTPDDIQRHRRWLVRLACDVWGKLGGLEPPTDDELAGQLVSLPIWPIACRAPEGVEPFQGKDRRFVAFDTLRMGEETILYADGFTAPTLSAGEAGFERPVLDASSLDPTCFDPDTRDVTDALRETQLRRENKSQWKAAPEWHPPEEERRPYRYESDDRAYQRGIYFGDGGKPTFGDRTKPTRLLYVKEGRELTSRVFGSKCGRILPAGEIVISGDLPPNVTWDGILWAGRVRSSVYDLVARLPDLVRHCRRPALEFLEARLDGWLLVRLLEQFTFDDETDRAADFLEWLEESDLEAWLKNFWGFSSEELGSEAPVWPERVRELFGAFGEAPLFEMVSGEARSLLELAECTVDGSIGYVELSLGHSSVNISVSDIDEVPGTLAFWQTIAREVGLERPVVACGETERAILARCFGGALESGQAWIEQKYSHRQFVSRTQPVADLDDAVAVETEDGDGFELRVGLISPLDTSALSVVGGDENLGRLHLEVAHEGRRLADREYDIIAGRFRAVARGGALTPDDEWIGVDDRMQLRKVGRRAKTIAEEMVRDHFAEVFEEGEASAAEQLAFWRMLAANRDDLYLSEWRDVPVFEIVDEGWMGHQDLSFQLAANDAIHFVRGDRPVLESALSEERAEVVRAPDRNPEMLVELLTAAFSVEHAIDVTDTDETRDAVASRAEEFRKQPPRPARITSADVSASLDDALIRADIEVPGIDGEMALFVEGATGMSQMRQIVLHKWRELTTDLRAMPLGYWVAVCSVDWLSPGPEYRDVKGGSQRLDWNLSKFAAELLERLLDRVEAADEENHPRARRYLDANLDDLRSREALPHGWSSLAERLESSEPDPSETVESPDVKAYSSGGLPVQNSAEPARSNDREQSGETDVAERSVGGEQTEAPEVPEVRAEVTERIVDRFMDMCGSDHPLCDAVAGGKLVLTERSTDGVEFGSDALRWDVSHPAVAPLLAEADRREDWADGAVDPIRMAVAVSSLYTALWSSADENGDGEEVGFYVEHLRVVAHSLE